MDTDLQISFFNCCDTSQQSVISVSETTSARYTVVERVLRHFKCWITVTAERVRRTVVRTFCAGFRKIVRNTGVQILRQSAILRI